MKTWLERSQRMLDLPLEFPPRALLVAAAALLLGLAYRLSLWQTPAPGGFRWIPFALGALGLLSLRVALIGKLGALVDLWVLYVYFSVFSMWSFVRVLVPSGNDFEFSAHPGTGFYTLAAIGLLLSTALALAWHEGRAAEAVEARAAG